MLENRELLADAPDDCALELAALMLETGELLANAPDD